MSERNKRLAAAVVGTLDGLSFADARAVLELALQVLETKSFVMSEPPKDNIAELSANIADIADKVAQQLAKTLANVQQT